MKIGMNFQYERMNMSRYKLAKITRTSSDFFPEINCFLFSDFAVYCVFSQLQCIRFCGELLYALMKQSEYP